MIKLWNYSDLHQLRQMANKIDCYQFIKKNRDITELFPEVIIDEIEENDPSYEEIQKQLEIDKKIKEFCNKKASI